MAGVQYPDKRLNNDKRKRNGFAILYYGGRNQILHAIVEYFGSQLRTATILLRTKR
jgi:hypothetical protein